MEKAEYFFKRAEETLDLEAKLILLDNAYNCLIDGFDGLKPIYSLVSMGKEEYRALINACANDADCETKCSPRHYDLEALCSVIGAAVSNAINLHLQKA